MTDRDTFAAAALTGILSQCAAEDRDRAETASLAYRHADAMLRERGDFRVSRNAKPNHDAAPAARASVESVAPQPTTRGDSARTDTAAPRPSEGTGDISEAQNDAIGPQSAAKTDTTQPRNGAPSGGPDPDSRVWETQRTPTPHATPPQGSVPGEGSVPRSGTENEPVAWGVMRVGGSWVSIVANEVQAETSRKSWDNRENWVHEIVPLYRQPQPTLTDEERGAIQEVIDYLQPAGQRHQNHVAATLRGLLERLGGDNG